jgi:hypothetical protein
LPKTFKTTAAVFARELIMSAAWGIGSEFAFRFSVNYWRASKEAQAVTEIFEVCVTRFRDSPSGLTAMRPPKSMGGSSSN